MHLDRALLLAFSCAACSARPEVTSKPHPVAGGHVRERRSIGLDIGIVARRRFSASYTEVGEDGTRSGRWTCSFIDRVGEVLDGARRLPWTVVEVQRSIDAGACRAPGEDWGLTPKDARLFFVFAGTEATHDVADYRVTRKGLAVFL